MKSIKYIVQYDTDEYRSENRAIAQSAVNKSGYVLSALDEAGYETEVISAAWSGNPTGRYEKRKVILGKKSYLTICPTFGAKSKPMKLLRMFCALSWLFFYLVKNTKRNDIVISYHDLMTARPVMWAKKLKGFKLILEANEKYNVVSKKSKFLSTGEEKIIAAADGYMFCNNIVYQYIGKGKPYAINYGNCTPQQCSPKNDDGNIHVVYAGIIDKVKTGAFIAANSAQFLDENYVLHIIGSGDKESIKEIKRIADNSTTKGCSVVYDGVLYGDEYKEYISSMHIGLSTQSVKGEYLLYSFPSKILSYMGLGLQVVSGRIPCIETSGISDAVYYYEGDSPKEVAKAIKSIDIKTATDNILKLNELHNKFVLDIKELIENI